MPPESNSNLCPCTDNLKICKDHKTFINVIFIFSQINFQLNNLIKRLCGFLQAFTSIFAVHSRVFSFKTLGDLQQFIDVQNINLVIVIGLLEFLSVHHRLINTVIFDPEVAAQLRAVMGFADAADKIFGAVGVARKMGAS